MKKIRVPTMAVLLISLALGAVPLAQDPTSSAPSEGKSQEKTDEQESGKQRERNYVVTVEERLPLVPRESVIATKLPVPIQETPASISVVPHSLFRSQDAVILSDTLRNAAGVNVQNNFGVHDYFYIRGFDSLSSGLVLTDGAPEPEATYYHLYNVEQLEVLRGPSAFLYGGSPLSGAVNLARKQPQPSKFVQASGTIGAFGTYRGQLDLNLGATDSPVAFRFNMLGQQSDQWRNELGNSLLAINPSLSWKINDRSVLAVSFEYATNEYTPDAGIPVLGTFLPDVSRRNNYGTSFDASDQDLYRFRVDWSHDFGNGVTIRDKFYYTDLDWLSAGTLLNGVFPDMTGGFAVQRIYNSLDNRQKLLGNQFEAVFRFNTGAIRHEMLTGVEVSRLGDVFDLGVFALEPVDLFNPQDSGQPPQFPIPGQGQQGDARTIIFAPYFLDRIALAEKVDLFAGGRLDTLDFEESVAGTDRSATQFNPMLGLVFSPTGNSSIYANASTAFSPPSSLVVGMRDPEESWQLEIGTKNQFFGGRLTTAIAGYHIEKNNIAIPDATGVTRTQGDQRSRGFEFESSYQHNAFWSTFVNYAFNDSNLRRFSEFGFVPQPPFFAPVDRSGNTAPFAPRHLFNWWTTGEFRNGIGIGGGARYVSGQFIAADNLFEIDGYLTFDAVLSYRVRNWRLSFHFKNITDREFETRGFGNAAVIPADPFGVYGTISFTM